MARVRVKKPTGTTCSDCGTPQLDTPSGITCENGHGGAPALEETRAAPNEVPPVGHEPEGPPTKPTRKRGGVMSRGPALMEALQQVGRLEHVTVGDPPVHPGQAKVDQIRERAARNPRSLAARQRVAEGIAATAPLEPQDGVLATPAQPVALRFVSLPTRRLIETERPEELLAGARIDGAIVKVTTNVKSSERELFDGAGIKARLLEHGARAVVLAPRIVSAGGVSIEAKMAAAAAVTDEEAVRAWFEGQTGLADDELAEAVARTLAILESV